MEILDVNDLRTLKGGKLIFKVSLQVILSLKGEESASLLTVDDLQWHIMVFKVNRSLMANKFTTKMLS